MNSYVSLIRRYVLLFVLWQMLTSSDGHAAAISAAATGNWLNTATWLGDVVPVSGDTVTIGNTYTVSVPSGSAASGTVTVSSGGNLSISGGNLTLDNNSKITNNGTIVLSSGTLSLGFTTAGLAFLDGLGNFQMTGGNFTLNAPATLTRINQNGNYTISGGSVYWDTRYMGGLITPAT